MKNLFRDKTTKTLAIIAGVLIIFYVFRSQIMGLFSKGTDPGTLTPIDPIDSPIENESPKKEEYLYTWVKKGSSGEAVKHVQQRANKIIDLCKKASSQNLVLDPEYVTNETGERINKLAKWTKLSDDGKFGTKTETLVNYITGKKGTSLDVMRKKYEAFEFAISKTLE